MFSVIHLEWLLLIVCCLLILLVGCNSIPTRTPVPVRTQYPPVTLTVVPFVTESPVPRSTMPARATQSFAVTPGLEETSLSSPPTRLHASPPQCYSSPHEGYLCMGIVWNDSPATVREVELRLRLRDRQQRMIAGTRLLLEQQRIPPASFAPYRVQFTQIQTDHVSASAEIIAMQIDETHADQTLRIRAQRGTLQQNGRYLITATIENTAAQPVAGWRLVSTVFNVAGHVVGYRVVESSEALAGQQQETVRIEVIPQLIADDLQHHLHLEEIELEEIDLEGG